MLQHASPCRAAVTIVLKVDVLVLQAAPRLLDEHVLHPSVAVVHRDAHTGCGKHTGEGRTGELAARLVLKISGLPKRQRLLRRGDSERDIHHVVQTPVEHYPLAPCDNLLMRILCS
jgi:hypothetical protein